MNIRSLATAVVAAAVLVAIPSGIAVAAENAEPANCADAVSELTEADRLHDEAVAADKAVVDAEDADQVLKDAKKDLKDAEEKLAVAQNELATVTAQPAETPGHEEALKAAQKKVDRLTDDVKDLTEARDDAKKAADGKTRKLREEANKTDAAAALTRLDDARDDFNRLCTEGEDDPTDNNDSSVVEDNDSASSAPTVVVTPQGGVNTGGGPA
jgi:chromosome segregation ATPase